MTASNSLGEQFKLYHASHREFKPGDLIHPAAHPDHPTGSTAWAHDYDHLGHDEFVWMKTNPEGVKGYGDNIYEVHPEGLTNQYHWPETGAPYKDTHVSLAPVRVVKKHEGPFIGDTK